MILSSSCLLTPYRHKVIDVIKPLESEPSIREP